MRVRDSKPYQSDLQVGERVRTLPETQLAVFRDNWSYHHPLSDEQMRFAGDGYTISEVSFYHGGDPLYSLDGVPGVWHRACLTRPGEQTPL